MANNYFQFKKFIIHQQFSAMKVCTDSCLFGALMPITLQNGNKIKTVVDIGTGTGLLSLQYAQLNNEAKITAIEIEATAFKEATKNVNDSIFAKQIEVVHSDFLTFHPENSFDLIICNPPFYENELQTNNVLKNIAHHSTQLTISNLLHKIYLIMHFQSVCCLLLPTKRILQIQKEIESLNLVCNYTITIYANEKQIDFRTILFISKTKMDKKQINITIKKNNNYTIDFTNLLQNFYLNF